MLANDFWLTIKAAMGTSCLEKRVIILVVEDDFLWRMDAVQMIEEAGFDVLEAANADEAIQFSKPDPT